MPCGNGLAGITHISEYVREQALGPCDGFTCSRSDPGETWKPVDQADVLTVIRRPGHAKG